MVKYYETSDSADDLLKSYFSGRGQSISIDGFNSNHATLMGPVPWSVFFIIYSYLWYELCYTILQRAPFCRWYKAIF